MKAYYYIFIYLFTGCAASYIPSPKNVPLFEEKGEARIEAGISTNSIYATGSYAFSDKYALITNGTLSFLNFTPVSDLGAVLSFGLYDTGGMHRSIEAGLGRYNLLPSSVWRLETFAGVGYGTDGDEGKNKLQYLQEFVQTNIGKRFNKNEIGWALRIASIHEIPVEKIRIGVNIEPLIFMRFGGTHFNGFIRYGPSIMLPFSTSTGNNRYFFHYFFYFGHLSAGWSYRF